MIAGHSFNIKRLIWEETLYIGNPGHASQEESVSLNTSYLQDAVILQNKQHNNDGNQVATSATTTAYWKATATTAISEHST